MRVFVLHTLVYLLAVLLDGFLGWWILDEFDLSYWTWCGIAMVGIAISRSAIIMNDLYKELTRTRARAKI